MLLLLILLSLFAFLIIVFLRLRKQDKSGLAASKAVGPTVLEVQISKNEEAPRDITASSLFSESMFASLHGILHEDASLQEHLSFEFVSSGTSGIKFYVVVPLNILKFVESQIYAHYPSAQIRVVSDYAEVHRETSGELYNGATLKFQKAMFFPLRTFREFETDPLSSLTSALSQVGGTEEIMFQFVIKPIPDVWQKDGFDYVNAVRNGTSLTSPSLAKNVRDALVNESVQILTGAVTGFFTKPSAETPKKPEVKTTPRLGAAQETELRSIENKLSKMGFEVVLRVISFGSTPERVENNLRSVLSSLKQFSNTNSNSLVATPAENKKAVLDDYILRRFDRGRAIILNVEELATVFHFPTSNIDTPNIAWIYSRKSEPPATIPTTNCTYIAETLYRNKKVRFGISDNDDRLRHMYLIGKSGTGKSTMLETMIVQDIKKGYGVGVLDPHGETIEKVLEYIPDERVEDVIYFDPSDTEKPIGLNLLEMEEPSQKNLMASGLVAAIKQHFDYSWGPRLEYLLNYAILTLLDVPGTTLLGITRLLEDANYQKYILHQVKDPVVIKFWEREFKEMKGNQKLVTEAIAPIQNKVNRFLASTTMRNILGQKHSTLDVWDAMNNGKILLINLSKGKIGSDNADLLGALLVSRIQFYALQRAKIPYEQRRPFYLYVDEFQNFATGSFEEILSESRKYKLGLYLTHQFTAQLPEQLLDAVYGNVGTIATFGLGAPDAKVMEGEFAPYFDSEDIISLERFQIYIKLMIDGMTSMPFSARILVPWEENFPVPKTNNKEKVIQRSREKYGVDRAYIESKINRWVETPFDKGMAIAQQFKSGEKTNLEGGNQNERQEN